MIFSENRFALFRIMLQDIEAHLSVKNLDGEIRDGRHHMQIRVYYENTDFSRPTLS
jgi:hypothetical protein